MHARMCVCVCTCVRVHVCMLFSLTLPQFRPATVADFVWQVVAHSHPAEYLLKLPCLSIHLSVCI